MPTSAMLYIPQVSGIKFQFDPRKPPGERIVPGSLYTCDFEGDEEPLDLQRKYKVAAKEYLAEGRDGYNVLAVRRGQGGLPCTCCGMGRHK